MDGINYVFDATQYDPSQMTPKHPVGKFLATVTATDIKPTKEATGGFYEVTFTTQAGTVPMRFNLWNQNQTSVDIAHRQLSALCHCVGIYKVTMQQKGRELMQGRCMIEVAEQSDPKYTQIVKFYDVNGNEPSKGVPAGQAQPGPQPQQMPQTGAPPMQPGTPQQQPQPWGGQVVSGQQPMQSGPWQGGQQTSMGGPVQGAQFGIPGGPGNLPVQGQPGPAWQPPQPQPQAQPGANQAPPWAQQR